jgi:uncharacterized protein YecE (DUF72 family)
MNHFIGTSGFSYTAWRGRFYPNDLAVARMLHYYGERFRTVEINNSFFGMPKATVLEQWASQVPANFRFALKAPRQITHVQGLRDKSELLSNLLQVAGTLQDRLGPLLFQLPPTLKKDMPRLRAFLSLLPSGCQAAFEFRHSSWFDDEVFRLLSDHRVALCVADAEDQPAVPFVATTDWGYLRLRRLDYDDAALRTWAQQIQNQRWGSAFVFFKHEDQGNGPRWAQQLMELLK